MDNSSQISEETKNEIYQQIVDLMLIGLESNALTAQDSEDASMFIMERLDKATDEFYLDALLEEFVDRWPIFSPLLQPKREAEAKVIDEQNIANIQNEIKNLNQ